MSLISCSECQRIVSDTAGRCPGCGAKIKRVKGPRLQVSGRTMTAFVIVAFALIGFGATREDEEQRRQEALHPGQARAEAEQKAAAHDFGMAYLTCVDQTKARLKDPDSGEFPEPDQAERIAATGISLTLGYSGRAKNSFGGKTVSHFVCQAHKNGADWVVDSIQERQ
jgi:hypothetical protein